MSLFLNIFLSCIILVGASFFSSSTNSPRSGRCRGSAVNYLISVPSIQNCLDACNYDERCCHYSHHRSHASHPDHHNCFLFSAEECDVTDLMYSAHGHWVTGDRTRASSRCPYTGVYMVLLRSRGERGEGEDDILNIAGNNGAVV